MMWTVCKSKIHSATITHTELNYEGSITIGTELMKAANIVAYERVQIVNLNNGSRMETYVIPDQKNSGIICLNGPAARKGFIGDTIHIISYTILDDAEVKKFKPKMIYLDKKNKIRKTKKLSID